MNLEIINNVGTFEIHGDFTGANTDIVESYFNKLLDTYYEVVLCLKQVQQIDSNALKVLQFITAKAKRRSKVLFVLGKENAIVFQELKKANLTKIFKNDYDC
ncbi:MAG: STAS domain-containing protein [Winogradskyella sp.]|uniref:STAS domain-containing protein n=1 Tax=Winogradskyella sp. TaxID=1883156 RepID=UPI000F3BC28C|nr:STAS domain-containing protein [Winogradskyella sp.]RNC86512.1 MAG: STAS domain-containing protein [Winogradskyella sp.]